jgi:hypothetical protein
VGFLLLGIVLIVSLVLALRAWRGYEAEIRRNSGERSPIDPFPEIPLGDSGSVDTAHSHISHHSDFGCGDPHHGGCDAGGHGGFDGGGHH